MKKITVRVPATTANLGPGFDAVGCALMLYNELTFEEKGSSLVITGCDEKYRGYDNLAVVGYYKTLNTLGLPYPKGLAINISGDVPISRGLGSSSTLIVAGVLAANHMNGDRLTNEELLNICCEIEGHPDNVAPAIYGGLTAALIREGRTISMRYTVDENIRFTALVPDFEMSTEMARAILPKTINRLDGVYTVGCLALLLKAFETGDERVLSYALDDKLHQPYRAAMIPQYEEIRSTALGLGCCGFVISGSGSTLLAIGGDEGFAARMEKAMQKFDNNWRVIPLKVDTVGAVITEEEI